MLLIALHQQKLPVLRELAVPRNLRLRVQGAGYVLPWLRRMRDGGTSAAFPLALCQGWYPPGTKVTDAERRQHPLAATSCMKDVALLFQERGAGFCHLTVSLRSPVAARCSGTRCQVTTWVSWVYAYLEIWHVSKVTVSWLSTKNKKRQSYGTVCAEALNATIFPVIWITKLLLPRIYLLFFMLSEQLRFSRRKGFNRESKLSTVRNNYILPCYC